MTYHFKLFLATATGAIMACASLFPNCLLSAVCGWTFGILSTVIIGNTSNKGTLPVASTYFTKSYFERRFNNPLFLYFLSGVVFYLLAFYWLPRTLQLFGGFHILIAWLLFIIFALFSALQFALVVFLYQLLTGFSWAGSGRRMSLLSARISWRCAAFGLAWMTSEYTFPRLFPWALAHTQISWTEYAVWAQYLGVYPLGGLLMLVAYCFSEAVVCLNHYERPCICHVIGLIGFGLFIALGGYIALRAEEEMSAAPKLTVGLIQGNLDLQEKRDASLFTVNLERYIALSREAVQKGADLIVWPESVVIKWLHEDLDTLRDTTLDFTSKIQRPLLFGGLVYSQGKKSLSVNSLGQDPMDQDAHGAKDRSDDLRYYNSAIGVDTAGQITGSYHKQVLMPFGEYLPFEKHFPSIRELSPQSGDFTAGTKEPVITISTRKLGNVLIGPSICYEDLIPRISRESSILSAELLVNLTNDAWYGDTSAPHQHNLLASWRAIETQRYMLRATNTGLTSIINPLGHMTASLPTFQSALLVGEVGLLKRNTLYTQIGDLLPQLGSLLTLLLVAVSVLQRRGLIRSQTT